MFRYLNIVDSEELRHNATKKMYFSHYQHYSNDFYMREYVTQGQAFVIKINFFGYNKHMFIWIC